MERDSKEGIAGNGQDKPQLKANEKNSKPPEDMPGQKNQGQKCRSSIENEETFAEVSIKEEAIVE